MGRAQPDDQDLRPGRILGPYELLVQVGAGGMARVWAARHRGVGNGGGGVFALKMLMPHLSENSAFRDMFFDEARIASRIRHENVARTFEIVELEDILTLVMEWVDGSSLIRMLRPGIEDREDHTRIALPIRHAVKILAETCGGLHAAHELVGDNGRPLAVVHRDVSPHNVLITRDGRVKVTDFGVAKALGKSHMTIAGQLKGKLAYMAPEQLIGTTVDRRTDVFALGSVLYEATTGQRPFTGEHDPQVMAAIMMGTFIRPSEVVPGYPRGLEEIVLRALATDSNARYATALELKTALESWLASSGPPIGPAQIAALLEERCGAELTARMGALPASRPVLPPASEPSETGNAMEVDHRVRVPPSDTEKGSSLSNVLAVLVGVVLGLAVLVYVRNTRREHRDAADLALADAGTAAHVLTTTVVDAGPRVALDGDRSARRPPPPTPPKDVRLHVPDGARLFVDGRELPTGTVTVARPSAGILTVLVKADGREDALVVVDPHSPEEIEVAMTEKHRPKHNRRAVPRPDPASTPGMPAMPPNPYE